MPLRRHLITEPTANGPLDEFLLVLWHGAGGDVDEAHLSAIAASFAAEGAVAARARFPYRVAGRRAPDRAAALVDDVAETAALLRKRTGRRRLILGGRSMGGRMASMATTERDLGVDGLLLVAYPLHPAGAPDKLRAEHLPRVRCPMLFLSGDRDPLCRIDLLRPVLAGLGARATLELFPGADHGLGAVSSASIVEAVRRWVLAARSQAVR
jgi:predicted alpha/beta-hydrolase family hydrolase